MSPEKNTTTGEVSPKSRSLENLRELRLMNAKERAARDVQRAIANLDPGNTPSSLADLNSKDFARDFYLQYKDMVALEALGCRTDEIAELLDKGGEAKLSVSVGDETVKMTPFGDRGLTVQFDKGVPAGDSDMHGTESVSVREAITERFRQSPAHQAVYRLLTQPQAAAVRETGEFSLTDDRLGTLCLLEDAGLVSLNNSRGTERLLSPNTDPMMLLAENDRLEVQHTDNSTSYTVKDGALQTTLRVNDTADMATLRFSSSEEYYYQERANQAAWSESLPFIETECARELFAAFDSAGLAFNLLYQDEMTRVGEADRFGGIYTQISRELAKWVNREGRVDVARLFVPKSLELAPDSGNHAPNSPAALRQNVVWQQNRRMSMSYADLEKENADIRERLLSIDPSSMGEAARVIIGLAQGAVLRNAQPAGVAGELPVTKLDMQMLDGACFDVATYYIGATERPGTYIHEITQNGVSMLEKTHGKHTFLLQQEAVLNGVLLPKGTLMQRGEDDGWAMLRLTPFCFADPVDQLATGSELAKAYAQEQRILRRIGGATLKHLVESVR